MKLSTKQAQLLAKQVAERLSETNAFKISADKRSEIKKYVEKREALKLKEDEAYKQRNAHEKTLKEIIGNRSNIYSADNLTEIIRKYELSAVPSVESITDEIILQAMFANEGDLEVFINKIVAKYSNKASKALSN